MPCHIAIFTSRIAFIVISSSQMSIQSTLALSFIFGYHCIFTQGLISSENVSLVCDRPGLGRYTGIRWSLKQIGLGPLLQACWVVVAGYWLGLGRQTWIRLYMLSQLVDSQFECGALTRPWFFPVEGFHVKIKCLLIYALLCLIY